MAILRWIRDGYVALGFLFVWLLLVYISVASAVSWHIAWIDSNFNAINFFVVIDGLFLLWQSIEERRGKFFIGGSAIIAGFALLVTLSRVIQRTITPAWIGIYAVSTACLTLGIIIYGCVELAIKNQKRSN